MTTTSPHLSIDGLIAELQTLAWISEERVEAAMQPYGSAAWQEPRRLAPAAPPGVAIGNLDLAVSAAGDAAVLWQQEPAECRLGSTQPCSALASIFRLALDRCSRSSGVEAF